MRKHRDESYLLNERCPNRIMLDPDIEGHYMSVLADYHGFINQEVTEGRLAALDGLDTCYLLGNIEGRMIGRCATEEDCDMIATWEAEMEEAHYGI